jgi:hypothetical protein
MVMFGSTYYHGSIRKYVITFGNMFNDIIIRRYDKTNTPIQVLNVPIAYGPKEKWLVRLREDPNLSKEVAISLPRIGFEITGMTYDPARRQQSVIRNVAANTATGAMYYQYTPVPYNINFALYVMVRNADDAAQIIEQIIPFFGPEWTNSVRLIPNMNITMDIPTILNDVSIEDAYEGDFLTRRALIYTLTFTMKAYFYGPVRNASGSGRGLIKRVQVDTSVITGGANSQITAAQIAETGRSSRIVITPGLLANGSPTTDSAQSIDYNLIDPGDDYGFAANTFFYSDGLKYDPVTGNDV